MPEHVYIPKLKPRPMPQHPSEPEGRIHLDVVVTDRSGNSVNGLLQQEFTLLDNNQPLKIASFETINGKAPDREPATEIILLIDQLNSTFQQVSFARSEIAKFLHNNDGQLPLPISIALLTHDGLRMQRSPSVDGHAHLDILNQIKGNSANIDHRLSGLSSSERSQFSVQQLVKLAGIESKKPGRKLLLWIGPGWPIDSDFVFSGRDQKLLFNTIVQVSNCLRQARVVVYNVSSDNSITSVSGFNQISDLSTIATTTEYESFLKPIKSPRQAFPKSLELKVIAVRSGGRVLGPNSDLVQQIDNCIKDANTFYRISFDPRPPVHVDDYHDLKIQLKQPGLTARTNAGFYNELF